MYQSVDFDYLLVSQKQLRAFNCFWVGFIIYTVTSALFSINFITNFKNAVALQGMGAFLFLSSSIFLVHFKFENKYLKYSFLLYIFWLLSIIARGFTLNSQFVSEMIIDDYTGMFPYFAPLILLFPQKIILYKRLFQVIIAAGVFYLILDAAYIRDLLNRDISNVDSRNIVESFSRHLGIPCTFLLITYSYQTKKIKYFALFITIITIVFAIIRARRGMLFTLVTPMLFAAFIYFIESKKKMPIFIISLISVVFISIYGLAFFNQSSFFSSFRSRADEDTRTGVEECYYNDMKSTDWIIGKGINGQYYCPHFDPNSLTDYRPIIETDYLNIILKGGIISISLFLVITLPAAVKGIFYSNNNLSKAAGFWILIWLMNLYPTTVVAFNLNYLLLWIAVGICYNKKIRSIPEDLMKLYFSRLAVVANQN
jgi:hypothetical protein